MGEEFSHHLLIESLSKCETSSLVPLISYIVFLNGLGTKSRKKDIEYAGKIEIKKECVPGMAVAILRYKLEWGGWRGDGVG